MQYTCKSILIIITVTIKYNNNKSWKTKRKNCEEYNYEYNYEFSNLSDIGNMETLIFVTIFLEYYECRLQDTRCIDFSLLAYFIHQVIVVKNQFYVVIFLWKVIFATFIKKLWNKHTYIIKIIYRIFMFFQQKYKNRYYINDIWKRIGNWNAYTTVIEINMFPLYAGNLLVIAFM